jgi:hypothetical protein
VRLVTVRVIVGVVLTLLGSIWFLQGIDVLGGSSMTGSSFWAVAGIVVGAAGVAVLLGARRQRS